MENQKRHLRQSKTVVELCVNIYNIYNKSFWQSYQREFFLKKRVKYIHDLCGTNCHAAVVFRAFSEVEGDDRK